MKQELIWELMKQAGELAYEEHKAKCLKEGLDPEHTVWSVTGAHYEKFAELIVQECCDWIDGSPSTDAGQLLLTKSFIIANLKGHFSVGS